MCFVIAGVQPKTRKLSTTAQRCPRCGLHQAYARQVDHYFSLFFIPLLRVKQGQPFLFCQRCQLPVGPESDAAAPPNHDRAATVCRRCGQAVRPGYRFCPHCGDKQ